MLSHLIMADQKLEEILAAFEKKKELFRLPYTLSLENSDVTVKYLDSMLRLINTSNTNLTRESIVHSFCHRFNADENEMHRLLNDPEENKTDYRLYTAFSVFIQQSLDLDDPVFFQEMAHTTFTDYQSRQIAAARYIPVSWVLNGMPSQFKNWTKVTQVEIEKPKGKSSFKIKRRTLDLYREKLSEMIGRDFSDVVMRRDCDLSLYAFMTTFQELYQQKDLVIERKSCEADSGGWSEYTITPSKPYRTKIQAKFSWLGNLFGMIFPWAENSQLRTENHLLKGEQFIHRQIVEEKTRDLGLALAQSERNRVLAGQLADELAEARSIGESHSLKNRLQSLLNEEGERYFQQIASSLKIYSQASSLEDSSERYFHDVCSAFGISPADLEDQKKLFWKLNQIEIDPNFESLFGDEVMLDPAYQKFKILQTDFTNKNSDSLLSDWDPFALLYSLRNIKEAIALAKDKISKLGKMEAVKEVRFSSALSRALDEALLDKKSKLGETQLELIPEVDYDPLFTTIEDLLVFMVRDLFYNAIDAGSHQVKVKTFNPSKYQKEDLPFSEHFRPFKTHPSLYFSLENIIPDMNPEKQNSLQAKADELNHFLTGFAQQETVSDADQISTKSAGGQGTRYLKNFFRLHLGQGHYQPTSEGMKLHIYFEKLGM